MREHIEPVLGAVVRQVENEDDLGQFRDFVRANLSVLACDSETTGLDMYHQDFKVRLVQFGTPETAYVLPVEFGGQFAEDARRALLGVQRLVFHNASFDLQVFEQCLGVPMEDMWAKTLDTSILAHLVNPVGPEEGGVGTSLEPLTAHYISEEVASQVKGLMTRLAKEHKTTKSRIWNLIDLEHPEFNLYAGMDTVLTARLADILRPLVPTVSAGLVSWEHEIAEICSYMSRNGLVLDVDYSEKLAKSLRQQEEEAVAVAQAYGVEKVNATQQVADALEDMGVRIPERTEKGARKVDKHLLNALVADGNKLAEAVQDAKKAHKWRETWVQTFLDTRDPEDRCHAVIKALRARTARMSITGIPAQTLPADDELVRQCFLADEGHLIGSVDYDSQELCVLAAQSGDRTMTNALKRGESLHLLTAQQAFGDQVVKGTKEYKAGKTTNFSRVYGGGVKAVADGAGIDRSVAKQVVEGFDAKYPGVAQYTRKLQKFAQDNGYITTPVGRRLPVDKGKEYAALNYMVQSTSRDVTCRGLIRLHKAGFTPYLKLPIHDEILVSLPERQAHNAAKEIGRIMGEQMGELFIDTDPKVGARSWGSLYKEEG